jgi:hypothetical protein
LFFKCFLRRLTHIELRVLEQRPQGLPGALIMSHRQRVCDAEPHNPTVIIGQLDKPADKLWGVDSPGIPADRISVLGSPARQLLVRFKCAQIGESRLHRTLVAELVESADQTPPRKPVSLALENPEQIIRCPNLT